MNAGLSIQAWSNLDMFYSLIAHFVKSLLRQFFACSHPFVEIILRVIHFEIKWSSFIKSLLYYGQIDSLCILSSLSYMFVQLIHLAKSISQSIL